jgi:dienelactone hydrolase/predicted Ser/Thr protein kinase
MAVTCPKCQAENPETKQFCGDCGTPLPSLKTAHPDVTETLQTLFKELTTGSTFAGRYQVIEELGKGGMGKVYKVLDKDIEEKIALKLLKPEVAADEELVQRFRNELKTARRIIHKNVCRMFDLGKAEGTHFITMEYVPGENLKSFIRRSGQLTIGKTVSIARQVCEGLREAHRLGIVHRDLKPQNIMIDVDGNVRIMDFGIARSLKSESFTGKGVIIGTPEYMSPEQVDGQDADRRSDIYSLGIVLYEMVTGQPPFGGDSTLGIALRQKTEFPSEPKKINVSVPEGLNRLIMKCLDKDPAKRYQNAEELLLEFDGLERAISTTEKAVSLDKPHPSRDITVRFRFKRYWLAALALIALVLGFFAVKFFNHQSKVRWARGKAVPEIMEFIQKGSYLEAFNEAKQAEKFIPRDSTLAKLWPEMSREATIETSPPGADVYLKDYKAADGDWDYLGKSPLQKIRIPIGFFRWRIEKPGFRTVESAASSIAGTRRFVLDQEESLPPGMVRVQGGNYTFRMVVINYLPAAAMEDFLIDKYEVTNKQFKEFVDRGGYQDRTYWRNPFEKDGKILSWEEAMSQFRDATGRPGPATWELGTYPEGRADFPVSGISWYEAAAYAESVGKSLPTIYHWMLAADLDSAPDIIPMSNFGGEGPARVGSNKGLGPFGTYDLAGNVKEWCWNESRGLRYLLGGAWDDPLYVFTYPFARSPFDRSAANGFRCIKNLSAVSEIITKPILLPYVRDFYKSKPVSDEVFNIYKRLYSYDKGELNPVVESTDESSEYWKKEKISFNAAYGKERVTAYLFLPKQGAPPYQTVIYFPGAGALTLRTSEDLPISNADYIIKSGRAVLYPIYKSTYERGDGFDLVPPNFTENSFKDHIIYWVKDLGKSIDYLETRVDIDSRKIGYLGASLGGMNGVFLLPWEKRIRACVLVSGGFVPTPGFEIMPEIDFVNLAPRIKIPTLMLNGRYDYVFPVEASQKPMFDFLGTPEEHKKHLLYDTAHSVPRNEMIKETLDWLDRYLGPVK